MGTVYNIPAIELFDFAQDKQFSIAVLHASPAGGLVERNIWSFARALIFIRVNFVESYYEYLWKPPVYTD